MHCKHCNTTKTGSDFYASNKNKCKECICSSVRANRLEKIDHYRAFDKARASQPHRVAARHEYAKTDAYATSHSAAVKRWRAKHPERRAANTTLGNALRDGRVIAWPVCSVPECCGRPQGHHPDYGRPLDVVWLCAKHHKEAHALVRLAA